MKVNVTAHAVTRFTERIYKGGSVRYIQEMVRNALAKGYPIVGDQLTFGVVTFVVSKHRSGIRVITCYQARTPTLPTAQPGVQP